MRITTNDPVWCDWSSEALAQAGQGAGLVINPLIYAEFSVAHSRVEALESNLAHQLAGRIAQLLQRARDCYRAS